MFRRPHEPVTRTLFLPEEYFHKFILEEQQRRIEKMDELKRQGTIKSMLHYGLMRVGIL